MAASIPALVEPLVLRWARESVGLSALAAARKLGVPDDRVARWEHGETRPTVAQLRKAAAVYKRPLGVFFLAQPPQDFDAMRDFRRHVGAASGQWSPELHGEYRRAQVQRENALELLELEDERPPTAWGIDDLTDGPEAAGAAARARLLAHAIIPLPTGVVTAYDHLNAWTAALEEAGVLVLATSRGGVAPSEMRAFSLHFDTLPIIVVNGADGARGRLFSMLHEYAHLILHTAGLCDTVTDSRATTPDRELEARCNAIAAATLMPADKVLAQPLVAARASRPEDWTYNDLRIAAAPFGVSAEALLRRLATLGRTTPTFYQLRREEFLAAYEADEAPNKVWAVDFQFDATTDGRPVKVRFPRRRAHPRSPWRSRRAQHHRRRPDRRTGPPRRTAGPPGRAAQRQPPRTGLRAAMADWARERVGLHFIPPGEPWRNGYVESFNSRIRDECLNINIFWSLAQARVVISDWKEAYNHRRRHSSLGYQAPAVYAAACTQR